MRQTVLSIKRMSYMALAISILTSFNLKAETLSINDSYLWASVKTIKNARILKIDNSENPKSDLPTVVKASGKTVGSGIPILFNGKVRVLTNSHIAKGDKEVSITYPRRTWLVETVTPDKEVSEYVAQFSLKMEVEFDLPLIDALVLKPKSGTIPEALEALAKMNGSMCTIDPCVSEMPMSKFNSKFSGLSSVLNDAHVTQGTIGNQPPEVIEDNLITGTGNILRVSLFTRPGVSGGAIYRSGRIVGLTSRVSYSGDHYAYGFSLSRIEQEFRKNQNDGQLDLTSRWESPSDSTTKILNTSQSPTLVVERNGDTFKIVGYQQQAGGSTGEGGGSTGEGGGSTGEGGGSTGEGGGSTGEGGGSTGEGGGSTGEGAQKLRLKTISKYLEISQGVSLNPTSFQIVNPFFYNNSRLLFNQKNVFTISYQYINTPKTIYVDPSYATYTWLQSKNQVSDLQLNLDEESLTWARKKFPADQFDYVRVFGVANKRTVKHAKEIFLSDIDFSSDEASADFKALYQKELIGKIRLGSLYPLSGSTNSKNETDSCVIIRPGDHIPIWKRSSEKRNEETRTIRGTPDNNLAFSFSLENDNRYRILSGFDHMNLQITSARDFSWIQLKFHNQEKSFVRTLRSQKEDISDRVYFFENAESLKNTIEGLSSPIKAVLHYDGTDLLKAKRLFIQINDLYLELGYFNEQNLGCLYEQ